MGGCNARVRSKEGCSLHRVIHEVLQRLKEDGLGVGNLVRVLELD